MYICEDEEFIIRCSASRESDGAENFHNHQITCQTTKNAQIMHQLAQKGKE